MFTDHDEDNDEGLQYTVAVDIWSLGCVLFRVLTRRSPFASVRTLGAYCRSKRQFRTDALLEYGVSKDGIAFVLEMMSPYPANRITATNALSHPWTCVQQLETTISIRPNIEKSPFQTATDQPVKDKSLIAKSTVQVNDTLSFNIDEGDGEIGESTALSPANLCLAHQRNGNAVDLANPKNNNQVVANPTIRAQS